MIATIVQLPHDHALHGEFTQPLIVIKKPVQWFIEECGHHFIEDCDDFDYFSSAIFNYTDDEGENFDFWLMRYRGLPEDVVYLNLDVSHSGVEALRRAELVVDHLLLKDAVYWRATQFAQMYPNGFTPEAAMQLLTDSEAETPDSSRSP